MAQRNINSLATVTDVASPDQSTGVQAVAELGQGIIERNENAKIAQSLSQAHTDLIGLSDQYKIDNESDPLGSMDKFKQARQELFDKYASNISPFFRQKWDEATTQLGESSDISQTTWAYEQTHKNTVHAVNDTMQNYLALAGKDGEGFGKDAGNQIAAFTNFDIAQSTVNDFATQNLGSDSAKTLMKDFKDDYVKTYVSGVVESSPEKALKLLDDPTVRDSMKDPEQFYAFKKAIEHRAVAVKENQIDGGVLAGIRKDNAPLQPNANAGAMTYAQLQQGGFSDAAKEYYSALNGFSGNGKRGGYTPADKAGYKMAVFDNVQKLVSDPRMDAASVRVVQDSIYKAMTVGAMTQAEGMDMVKQITEPLVAKKEEAMGKYNHGGGDSMVGNWFADDVGFNGIQEFYDKNVHRDTEGLNKDLMRTAETANVTNKAKLYDYYMGALTARAGRVGVPLAQITDLPFADRKKIYGDAQKEAQRFYLEDHHPSLRTLPDTPNFVYTNDGRLVQGMTGDRALKPAATAKANFKYQKDTDTNAIYRVFPDGTKELYSKGNK